MLHREHLQSLRPPAATAAGHYRDGQDWPRRFAELAAAAEDSRLQAFYAAAIPTAATPISAVALAALDVETTGLDPQRDEIVSIGVVPMTLARIEASASRYWLLNPQTELKAESVTIHAITHAQVEAAPDFDAIVSELLASLRGRILVVHCRDIERRFLDVAFRARLGEGIEFPVIDTMALEARLHRRPVGLLTRLLRRRRRPVSIRLADSRARYRLPRYRAHHALTDALATAELLQAQIAHHYRPDTALGKLWL